MGRTLTYELLMCGMIALVGCGSKEGNKPEVPVVEEELAVDSVTYEMTEDGLEVVEEISEEVPVFDMTESEILDVYEANVNAGNYEKAGESIYLWLKEHDSDKVVDKLEELSNIVYKTDCVCTMYDADDNVVNTSYYTYDKHGNMTTEEVNSGTEQAVTYSYSYIYDGDVCVSEIDYDGDGNITYSWEAELNEEGLISKETKSYNNMTETDVIEHTYKSGSCVRELETYTYADGTLTESHADYTYDENGNMTSEVYYDAAGLVHHSLMYEYDENGNKTLCLYKEPDGTVYNTVTYEYDEDGNLTKEAYDTGQHQESYVYTYDKFGNMASETYYMHDDIHAHSDYEYDFLGNIVIESIQIDGVNTMEVHDYTYALKE